MKQRVFYSSVHPITKVFLVVLPTWLLALTISIFLEGNWKAGDFIASVLIVATIIFLIWILVDTKYIIRDDIILHYHSGPIRGKINIQSIRKIEFQYGWVSKSLWKASLDKDGLYIYYNKFDDVYISPKHREEFVNYLLKINPKIELI